ncbi:hypothetical protein LCGC14_2824100 [marine sediment metagenome]|uniref:Cupin 2 conserved barrel domain-containing protein n=1 Tax=marine sediment metagenome TaxID=412755 RepID=A0A0F8YG74_9ZZZZ
MIAEIKQTNLSEQIGCREQILAFEEMMKEHPDAVEGNVMPLKHSFSPGIYMREVFLPKGMLLTGKIHRHEHPNVLLKGKIEMVTESGGVETMQAPQAMISPAGTKRVIHVLEDVVWITFHHNPNNETDIDKLEKEIVVDNYTELPEAEQCLSLQ